MKELKCPNCGHVFHVDRDMFESIANQVRNAAFEEELQRRVAQAVESAEAKNEVERVRNEAALKTEIDNRDRSLAVERERVASLDKEISNIKQAIGQTVESERLKIKAEVTASLAERDNEIVALKSRLAQAESDKEIALLKQKNESESAIQSKNNEIAGLKSELQGQAAQARLREAELKEQHSMVIRQKDEQISFYKDMKTRLSTKMIGESLELHCENLFREAQNLGSFATGVLHKDNDASRGSKGDYIYRDFDGDREVVSIMFEMKNEADTTSAKHRNSDFFEKLDRDRREKNCEYAVLVSLLERDSDHYNSGLVTVPPPYEKMYVVRPQMFTSIIALLTQTSRKNLKTITTLRNDLEIARAQSVDVTKFEKRRDDFVSKFNKLLNDHTNKHNDAIDGIDKVIASLEKQIEQLKKVKSNFETSQQKLVKANDAVENDFTIKKLTYGNPTMKAKFEEARRLAATDDEKTVE